MMTCAYLKGFSPVWYRSWNMRALWLFIIFPQKLHLNFGSPCLSIWLLTWKPLIYQRNDTGLRMIMLRVRFFSHFCRRFFIFLILMELSTKLMNEGWQLCQRIKPGSQPSKMSVIDRSFNIHQHTLCTPLNRIPQMLHENFSSVEWCLFMWDHSPVWGGVGSLSHSSMKQINY